MVCSASRSCIRVVRAFGREEFESGLYGCKHRVDQAQPEYWSCLCHDVPHHHAHLEPRHRCGAVVRRCCVDEGLVEVGSLTAFIRYLMQILMAVMMGVFMLMMLPRAIVCARRIKEVLRYEHTTPPENSTASATGRASSNSLTSHASTRARKSRCSTTSTSPPAQGTVTAIIGSTGSGKSTLMGLIPHLYYPTSGQIRIGGRVAMVPQKPWLYRGTVAESSRGQS